MYYGGFLWSEVNSLPVAYKKWFIERIVKELNRGGSDSDNADAQAGARQSVMSKALHQNSPDVRALQGNPRPHVPSRMRRF